MLHRLSLARIVVAVAIVLVGFMATPLSARCVFMAPGGKNSQGVVPVVFREDPIPADWSTPSIESVCDQFHFGQDVCCNVSQVVALKAGWPPLDASFGSCAACVATWKRLWCHFTCSTEQSDFMQVTKNTSQFVEQINFVVSNQFGNGLWESCKDTKMGSAPIRELFADFKALLEITKSFGKKVPKFDFVYKNYEPNSTLPGFLIESVPCEKACLCDSCKKMCRNITIDFGECSIYGYGCLPVAYVSIGALATLVFVAMSTALVQRGVDYYKSKKTGMSTRYHHHHQSDQFPSSNEQEHTTPAERAPLING